MINAFMDLYAVAIVHHVMILKGKPKLRQRCRSRAGAVPGA